ncbi:MAG: ABC transporter substrate-binding protein [Coriobacteriia bacterium]|nr:ABC transporter substrate-binding protein [Coriobacteriia bacterium]
MQGIKNHIPYIKYQSRTVLALVLAFSLSMAANLAACSQNDRGQAQDNGSVDVRVASLKGPTSIGLISFVNDVENNIVTSPIANYQFAIYGTADEILPQLISGTVDIALVPANVASILYNRTDAGVTVLNINTLGVLYIVSADDSINGLSDLAGRSLLMTGKGSTPEYIMDYLLKTNGLSGQVKLEYKSEATELAAIISADPTAVALLPEPYVSVVTSKDPSLQARISLTDEWRKSQSGGQLVTGVTLVRNAFLEEHPDIVAEFIGYHEASVEFVNNNASAAAEMIVAYGIIDDAEIAAQAIPRCYLVCLTDEVLQVSLSKYLEVLYDANPESIGGALPGDGFYYQTK